MHYVETIIHLMVARTIMYLEETGYSDISEKFPGIRRMAGMLTQEDLSAWASAGAEKTDRYQRLLMLMGNDRERDDVLQTVLDLCLAVLYVPEFAAMLKYYTGSGVTLRLAYLIEGVRFPSAEDVRRKVDGIGMLCWIDRSKSPIQYLELNMDDRIFHFLLGNDDMDGALLSVCRLFVHDSPLHPLYVNQQLAKEAADFLSVSGHAIQLAGKGGRRFLVRHIGRLMKRSFLFLPLEDLESFINDNFDYLLMILRREALFSDAGVCIYGIGREKLEKLGITETALARRLALSLMPFEIPLILCTDASMNLSYVFEELSDENGIAQQLFNIYHVPEPDYAQREQVWQGFAAQYGMDIDSGQFAVRYRLTPSEIASVIAMWRAQGPGNMAGDDHGISRICYDVASKGIEDKVGKVIYPKVLMSDLMVDKPVRDLLGQAIASVNGSHQIFEEWNLKSKYAYGRAVTVLLTGPPGTGKTMSAHAIAHELGIPMYQVNLSNIVDKYIGETEKHLEQAFSFAEKTNMVLFFDEADSLFGKRSEVSDAKDKYANIEVSYLLQRIEQFEGIAIMATNFINNIDPAFLRRMKYVIRFQPPDERQRLSIWESCILPELPVDDLDLPYLARQFDFSGGTIKNILLNACSIAIYEDELLGMGHILKAIKDEYIKTERIVDRNTWGEYGYLMDFV